MTEEQQSNYLYACIFYSILLYNASACECVFCEVCKVKIAPPPSLLSGILNIHN
jgi:hypothetical protein